MSSCDSPTEPIDVVESMPTELNSSRRADQAALPQFRLVRPLGEGTTSRVYLATEPSGRPIVVKLIGGRFVGEDSLARRHRTALSAVASIEHPNIMAIRSWGRARDGRVFVVMPHAERARDLRTWMLGPMQVDEVRALGRQLLSGLAAMHRAGLVHCDVKPSNCLVLPGEPPGLQIFDFGSVIRVGKARLSRPRLRSVYGTHAYLAPERHEGLIGPSGDLYSAGVMLFEALTGRRPYLADDPEELRRQHARDPVPFVQRIAPQLPSQLDLFFRWALAKHPLKRFRNARTMSRAFDAALEGASARALSRIAS